MIRWHFDNCKLKI